MCPIVSTGEFSYSENTTTAAPRTQKKANKWLQIFMVSLCIANKDAVASAML